MSSEQTYPIILKKTNLRDLISESQMLREFSAYGCDEQPGKVFGYNPFTKKCIDITDFDGPSSPMAAPSAQQQGGGSITQVFTDPLGLAKFLYGVYFSAFDPEEVMKCITENPAFSGLGFILGSTSSGRSIITFLPKVVAKAVGSKVAPGIQQSLRASQSLEAYKMAHRGWGKKFLDGFVDFLSKQRGRLGTGIALIGGGILVAAGAIKAGTMSYPEKKDTHSFFDWAIRDQLWGNESFNNFKCMGAAMVASVVLGALGRSGSTGLLKVTGKLLTAPAVVPTKVLKAIFRSKAMKNTWTSIVSASLKGMPTKNLEMFQELQKANLIPDSAKIFLDKADGAGTLKVSGLSDNISIPADKIPDNLKKFAGQDGTISINVAELQGELSAISTKINNNINSKFQGSASDFGNSPYQKQLKLFKKTLDKYGSLSTRAVKSQAFENSVELLKRMHDEADAIAKNLNDMEKVLLSQKSKVKSSIKNLADGTRFPDLRKVELDILKTNTAADVPGKLDELYPGLKSSEPGTYKEIEEYFSNYKDFDSAQKELISQLEVGRAALVDETGLLKGVLGNSKNSKDLDAWLSSEAGAQWAMHWNTFPTRASRIINRMGSSIKQNTKDAFLKFLSNEDLMIIGAGAGAAAIANSVKMLTKVENQEEMKQITLFLDNEVNNMNFEDYVQTDPAKVKTQEILLRLILKLEGRKNSFSSDTKKALTEWEDAVRNNKEYNAEIDKFMMRDGSTYPTRTEILNRIKAIVRGTLSPSEAPTKTNEVKTMNKKDLRNLISEILSENTGQGYAKYPYHSDRYDEEQEPAEDYVEEWKALELECMQDKTRNTAINIAKILVRDLELFNDVLDLAGSNQSVGTEILSKLKEFREQENT